MKKIKIEFINPDNSVINTLLLNKNDKIIYTKPKKLFYKFNGWNHKVPKYATENMVFQAKYKPINKNYLENEKEFNEIIKDIINNEEYLKRKEYHHHGETSVYDHCLNVAYYTYRITKKLKLDYKSATTAAILHDFYYKDWQLNKEKRPLLKQHGFVHAKEALENSRNIFPNKMNKKVENAILRHMFPLNICPPLYLESWIVSISDKYVSLDALKDYKIFLSFFSKKYRK